MKELSDYPDEEVLSHLLEGVRFKADTLEQIVLRPHLVSLSYGFVSVHKELVRLMEAGCFEYLPTLPYVPWNTLPMGVAFRKKEPDRPRLTTEGGAPRRMLSGASFLVDMEGVRAMPLNLLSKWPAADMRRGTADVHRVRGSLRGQSLLRRATASTWEKKGVSSTLANVRRPTRHLMLKSRA